MNEPRPFVAAGIVATALLLSAALWAYVPPQLQWRRNEARFAAPPQPDVSGAEPAVQAAVREARQAVVRAPRSATAWGRQAMTLDVHDLPEHASLCYERAADLDPREFRWPYLHGRMLRTRDPRRAAALLRQALRLAPNEAVIHVRLGNVLSDLHELAEARRHFERAAQLDPRSSHAWLGLARLALADEQPREALEHLNRAEPHAAGHGAVFTTMARAYHRLGDQAAATQAAARAEGLSAGGELDDPTAETLLQFGVSAYWCNARGNRLSRLGRHAEAAREYRRAAQARPETPGYWLNLAAELARIGRLDEAAEACRRELALRPDDVGSHNRLGALLCRLGRTDEGIHAFRAAVAVRPSDPQAYSNLWLALVDIGRVPEGLTALREGARSAPDDAPLRTTLAWVLATHPDSTIRSGRKAIEHARKACALTHDKDARSLLALAAARAELGDFEAAVQAAQQALATDATPRAFSADGRPPGGDADGGPRHAAASSAASADLAALVEEMIAHYRHGERLYQSP